MTDCGKFKGLLMGLIDNELTPEETHEINDHMTRCASCREEYDQIKGDSEKIGMISFTEPTDEELARLWKRPYSRMMKVSGLVMVLGGWLTLVAMAIIEMFKTSDEPLLSRIAGGTMLIGIVVLLIYVIFERITSFKSDPYKEVKR